MTRDELVRQCQIDVYRGGTLDVRVTHLPTGMVEEEKNARSQHLAREACLWRLGQRLVQTVSDE
jgi:protein subunit release factor A